MKTNTSRWLLTLSAMVMLAAGVPTSTTTTPSPRRAHPAAAEDKRAYMAKKSRSPASRIRPIASKPLEVRDGDPNSDAALAEHFLAQYGYHRKVKPLDFLLSPPLGSDSSRHEDEQTRALRLFQSYYGLAQTGKLDSATLRLMKKSRCGVSDIPPEEEEGSSRAALSQSPSTFTLLGTKWNKNRISWKIDTRSTNQLSPSKQREVLQRAFQTWRNVAPLEFQERSGKVDIDIKFGSRYHGDDYPFDGEGKVLAHAFGPGEGDIDGDMHIDNSEDWTSAAEEHISDLYLVATHELGHSLGLAHSRDPEALMYPYYGLTDRLGPDDIKAIQSLYGIRIGQRTTRAPVTRTPRPITTTRPTRRTRRPITTRGPYTRRPTTTERPRPTTTTSSSVAKCGVQFDVVIQDSQYRHAYYGIRGNWVYRFNSAGVLPGYPTRLNSVFPGAPSHAETVFTVPEKYSTYFIKDNKVWRYRGSRLDRDYPKDLNPTHFPEVIRFVLPIVDSAGHRRIFVFGRTLWWEYNFDDVPTGTYYRPRPNLIPQYWPAISSDVSYAVLGADKYIYLITPHSHIVLDSFRRALNGGPQEGHPQWMMPACQMRQTSSGAAHVRNSGLAWVVAALSVLLTVLTKC